MELTKIWAEALQETKGSIPSPAYNSLISTLSPVSQENNKLVIAAPTRFNKEMVESRYFDVLCQAISSRFGSDLEIVIEVSETEESPASNPEQRRKDHPLGPTKEGGGVGPPKGMPKEPYRAHSAKKYTFENFVVGSSNRFPYAAAQMVSEYPGRSYNPLFIYGGTGLGKTHLLLAIDDYSRTLNQNLKVRYVETSSFIDDVVNNLRDKKHMRSFDSLYMNYDILLVDDIHILGRTEFSQHKFFDIFNRLHSTGAQIVLSSDRPPRDISTLEERLRSRFSWGLTIDIKPPDLETRIAIIRMKAQAEKVHVPDDVFLFIASKVKSNIRELEGCLNRVLAHSRLDGCPIDLEMAEDVLSGLLPESSASKVVSIDLIQNVACDYYNLERHDLVGSNRSRPLVHARQIAMYLCRELTDESLIQVGNDFGGRDHSTVIHSCKKVDSTMKQDRKIFNEIQDLTNLIKSTA